MFRGHIEGVSIANAPSISLLKGREVFFKQQRQYSKDLDAPLKGLKMTIGKYKVAQDDNMNKKGEDKSTPPFLQHTIF